MKIFVIGGGGREHALVWKLSQSSLCEEVTACPGNPGIAQIGRCIPSPQSAPQGFLDLARQTEADVTIVGPEAPLVAGVVDVFRAAGKKIIGPTAAAAQLEGSKAFAKAFLLRAGIPTARSETAEDAAAARAFIDAFGFPVVLKADGLAAGKGVIIAGDRTEAHVALEKLPRGKVVVEQFLEGEEVSFIACTDGEQIVPLEPTQDHKTVGDGDSGPNTGGMGAYCDGRILTDAQNQLIMELVMRPAVQRMKEEGVPYTGFLYAGLMMTAEGPKVLEFNARLGDPETQPLMHRLDTDLLAVLLDNETPRWRGEPSVCVVLAAHGYPGEVRTGDIIAGIEQSGATVFHAGTRRTARGLETAGGRVLGVTDRGTDLASAIQNTYRAASRIHFDGMHYRTDIGRKGLKRW